jgi:hypothetical protein
LRCDPPWEDCCEAHDEYYWRGGTWLDRLRADIGLYECIRASTTEFRAWLYFTGVRLGGSPLWPTTYRFGYRDPWWPPRYNKGGT